MHGQTKVLAYLICNVSVVMLALYIELAHSKLIVD